MYSEELSGDLTFKVEARNAMTKELKMLRSRAAEFAALATARIKENNVVDRADAAVRKHT